MAISRTALIQLGQQALSEIKREPFEPNETSIVFEDAFREYAPSLGYLADHIRQSRGFFQERIHIRQAVDWLERQPIEKATQRAQERVEGILSRAWDKGLISRADEDRMPILRHLPNHIRHGVQIAQHWLDQGPMPVKGAPSARRLLARDQIRNIISIGGFRLYRRSPPALKRLADRVADAIMEEAFDSLS